MHVDLGPPRCPLTRVHTCPGDSQEAGSCQAADAVNRVEVLADLREQYRLGLKGNRSLPSK